MATFIDFASSSATFHFGPGATTIEGTLNIKEVDGDFYRKLLGHGESPPPILGVNVSVEDSKVVPRRVPAPSWWRHPIKRWRWNPLMTERTTLLTKLQVNSVELIVED